MGNDRELIKVGKCHEKCIFKFIVNFMFWATPALTSLPHAALYRLF